MKTYTVKAKLCGDHSLLTFDNIEVAYRWLLHDDGSQAIANWRPGKEAYIKSFIYGAKGLQSFIDEYFNPDVVKLEVL